jgi:hypothetical protein
MSNVTPTDRTDRLDAKPAWTRCGACKQRLWNDRVDIEVHRAVCPADLLRALRRLTKTVDKLEARVEELERRPEAHVVELEGGPVLDFEHEAPWPDAPPADGPEDDEEDGVPAEVPDIAPPASLARPRPSYFDDEDDEDDLDPASIRASVR